MSNDGAGPILPGPAWLWALLAIVAGALVGAAIGWLLVGLWLTGGA